MPATQAPARTLAEIRTEIEGIDRSLLLLMSERVRVAREAIEVRRRLGEKVTHRAQERRVLGRALRWAEELGLSPQLVTPIVRQLIAEGKRSKRRSIPTGVVTVYLTNEPVSEESDWVHAPFLRPARPLPLAAASSGGAP